MLYNMKSKYFSYLKQESRSSNNNYSDDMRGGKSRQLDKKANEYYIPVTDTDQGYVFVQLNYFYS